MTPRGTFIINGTERVVVSQLVRSPGVYFAAERDKTSDKDHLQRQGHPEPRRVAGIRNRQARRAFRAHRPQAQAAGHAASARARPGGNARRDHRSSGRRRNGAAHARPRPRHHQGGIAHRVVQALPSRRAAHHRFGAHAAGKPVLQPAALRLGEGGPLQDQQEAGLRRRLRLLHAHRRGHHQDHAVHRGAACRRRGRGHRRHRPFRATAASARWASSSRTSSASACRAWSAWCASA